MTYNATISACEVSCQQERAFQLQDDTQTRGRMQTFDALTFPIKKVSTSVNVDLSLFALTPRRLARTATKAKATSTAHDLKAKTTISIVSGKGGATHSNSCSLPLEVSMLTFSALTFPIKSFDWREGAGSHSGSWFWVSGGANGCPVGRGVGLDGGAGGSPAGRVPGLDRTPIDLKPFILVFYISEFYFVIDVGAKTFDSISDAFRVAYRAAFSVCENRPDKLSLGGRESRGWTRWDLPTHILQYIDDYTFNGSNIFSPVAHMAQPDLDVGIRTCINRTRSPPNPTLVVSSSPHPVREGDTVVVSLLEVRAWLAGPWSRALDPRSRSLALGFRRHPNFCSKAFWLKRQAAARSPESPAIQNNSSIRPDYCGVSAIGISRTVPPSCTSGGAKKTTSLKYVVFLRPWDPWHPRIAHHLVPALELDLEISEKDSRAAPTMRTTTTAAELYFHSHVRSQAATASGACLSSGGTTVVQAAPLPPLLAGCLTLLTPPISVAAGCTFALGQLIARAALSLTTSPTTIMHPMVAWAMALRRRAVQGASVTAIINRFVVTWHVLPQLVSLVLARWFRRAHRGALGSTCLYLVALWLTDSNLAKAETAEIARSLLDVFARSAAREIVRAAARITTDSTEQSCWTLPVPVTAAAALICSPEHHIAAMAWGVLFSIYADLHVRTTFCRVISACVVISIAPFTSPSICLMAAAAFLRPSYPSDGYHSPRSRSRSKHIRVRRRSSRVPRSAGGPRLHGRRDTFP